MAASGAFVLTAPLGGIAPDPMSRAACWRWRSVATPSRVRACWAPGAHPSPDFPFAFGRARSYLDPMPMDPPPDLSSLSLTDIARLLAEKRLPPVEKWNPDHCGDSEMRIARDGTWF